VTISVKFSADAKGWPLAKVPNGDGTRKTAKNFNWLSRVHERYRQTDDRQTDGRQHIANVNVSSLSLKIEIA